MATVTISYVTGQGTVTSTKTVSSAHLLRLIAAFQAEANASLGGATATNDQVLTYLSEKTFQRWKDRVREYESGVAWNTAISGVSDITIS